MQFNFTKAVATEVLFQFEPANRRGTAAAAGAPGYTERGAAASSPALVVINVSPIEYGHVLLVPSALSCLPQQIAAAPLLTALHLAAETDSVYFRLGYNSLGAYASVNHLHFQGYYLYAPFPIERAPTGAVPSDLGRRRGRGGPSAHRTTAFPVRCLVFELGLSMARLARCVAACCIAMQAANLPFNLVIADKGARVFLSA